MEDNKAKQRRPKDGYFNTLQELKLYHLQKTKQQEGKNIQKIPIAFQHYSNHKKGVQLFYAKPQLKMQFIFQVLSKKAIEKQKARQHQAVLILIKDNKKSLNIQGTVLQKYEKFKNKDNILHLCYQLHSQCVGYPLTGYQLAALFVIIPLALPVVATVAAFDWSCKKIKNMKAPTLPSIKMPTFGNKQHHFKFKDTFTLEQRKQKAQQTKLSYSDQIVTIIERHERSILPELPYCKFIVKSQMAFRQFCLMMQDRVSKYFGEQKVESKHSFFFVICGKIPHHDHTMESIYQKFKDEDGMLYVTYQQQESF